ncbi:MAG: hypothetical protein J7K68_04310 [Candidatus Diapherotrites archaeon]|nr:hypothetical protein [Candidatus Diapherotrites archaeon]
MEGKMKRRLALLGLLLIAVGITTVLVAGNLRKEGAVVKVATSDGDEIVLQQDGNIKIIETNFTGNNKEFIENKVIEIALKNETIRDLVGENYQVNVHPKVKLETKVVEGKKIVIVPTTVEDLYNAVFQCDKGNRRMIIKATVDLEKEKVIDMKVEEKPEQIQIQDEIEIMREATELVAKSGKIPKCPLKLLGGTLETENGKVKKVRLKISCGNITYQAIVDWQNKEVLYLEEEFGG